MVSASCAERWTPELITIITCGFWTASIAGMNTGRTAAIFITESVPSAKEARLASMKEWSSSRANLGNLVVSMVTRTSVWAVARPAYEMRSYEHLAHVCYWR